MKTVSENTAIKYINKWKIKDFGSNNVNGENIILLLSKSFFMALTSATVIFHLLDKF